MILPEKKEHLKKNPLAAGDGHRAARSCASLRPTRRSKASGAWRLKPWNSRAVPRASTDGDHMKTTMAWEKPYNFRDFFFGGLLLFLVFVLVSPFVNAGLSFFWISLRKPVRIVVPVRGEL